MNKPKQIPGLTAREVDQLQRVSVIVTTLRDRLSKGPRKNARMSAVNRTLIHLIGDGVNQLISNDGQELYSSISLYQQAVAMPEFRSTKGKRP